MKELPVIDAHCHFWDLSMNKHPWLCGEERIPLRYGDYSSICKDFLVDDYKRVTVNQNVVKAVHMEAEWENVDPVGETKWLHKLHDETGYPHAIVGQAWFDRDDIQSVLAGHSKYPLVRSVRQKPKASVSAESFKAAIPGSMADPKFRDGYRHLKKHNLHYDLQTPWWHLGEAADLARDFPDTTIILNHTGLPFDRSISGISAWREAMETFAGQPNTAVKISGICVPGEKWAPDLNGEVVLETIRIFSVDRCLFASNFPVDGIWASYDEIFDGFKSITASLSDAERCKLFHDNAMKFYRPI